MRQIENAIKTILLAVGIVLLAYGTYYFISLEPFIEIEDISIMQKTIP